MESLQVKLHSAERKLQSQQVIYNYVVKLSQIYNHVLTISQIYNVVLLRRAVPAEGARYTRPLRDNPPVETTSKEGSLQDWWERRRFSAGAINIFFKHSSNVLLYREVPGLANGGGGLGDKEMMILLQQRKIAALDEANNRLVRISNDCYSCSSKPLSRLRYTSSPNLVRRWQQGGDVLRRQVCRWDSIFLNLDNPRHFVMVLLILLSTGDAKDSGRVTGFVQRHSCLTEKLVEALIFIFVRLIPIASVITL